jgi:hypothetical protein
MLMEGIVIETPPCDAMSKELPASRWLAGLLEHDLRLLSWRERCSERLNARLQNWHLYLFSFSFSLSGGAVPLVEALRLAAGDAMGSCEAPATADMLLSSCAGCGWVCGRFRLEG